MSDDALWRLYDQFGPDYARITDALNASGIPLTRSQVRHRIKKGRPVETETVESEPGEPVSLADLLEKHAVDTTLYDVERFVVNEWNGMYQTKAHLTKKPGASLETIAAALLADIRADAALRPRITHKPLQVPPGERYALVVDIFDLHLGKLAWAEEVGESYDAKIAAKVAQDAVRDLLWQASLYPLEQIILPIGQDFFNADNLIGTTTGGTHQDVDTRFHLMFRRGRALASWMIHECAKIAPVVVPCVPGNHDRQTTFCLGVVLEAEFQNDPRVAIDNTARVRKYHLYGRNLLGFTHGDEEKPADLPQTMATEVPELWARSTYREFQIGHFHHGKEKAPIIVDDKTGATVRWIRSLSGSDRWHSGKAYLSRRGAEAFVLRQSGGLRAHLFTYPEQQAA